jgi:GAF domain-containing protein
MVDEEILWTLFKESNRLVDTPNFALAIYDDRTDTLNFLVFEQGERKKPCSVKLSDNQGLASRVLKGQMPLLIHDLPETGIIIATDPICPDQPIRSWLSVPICNPVAQQGAQGVIVVWSDQPNAFSEHQLRLFSALGAQATIAVESVYCKNVC